ncbi:MAG: hypothetical protein K0R16_1411 [Nitrososphaeraceae archaeon]|nr:hypothetical protein [Nitrososphaeraceae archaeon]
MITITHHDLRIFATMTLASKLHFTFLLRNDLLIGLTTKLITALLILESKNNKHNLG